MPLVVVISGLAGNFRTAGKREHEMTITATTTPGKSLLTPSDHTLVMIDFQSQMAFATKSIDPVLLRNNAALVANNAAVLGAARS